MPYPYNPYPYGVPQYGGYQPAQSQQSNTYAFVNGIEGAKSYPMAPNQTVMLMDSDNPIAYMKTSNAMGQATIKYFKLVETNEAELKGQMSAKTEKEYVTRTDFDALSTKVGYILKKMKEDEGNAESVQHPQ